MKPIRFLGTSLDDLRQFPMDARQEAGYQLDKVQHGLEPSDWKPIKTVGDGVREIRIRDASGAFRVIYLTKLADSVFVLHCFQKKTAQTSQKDVAMARRRLKDLMKEQI